MNLSHITGNPAIAPQPHLPSSERTSTTPDVPVAHHPPAETVQTRVGGGVLSTLASLFCCRVPASAQPSLQATPAITQPEPNQQTQPDYAPVFTEAPGAIRHPSLRKTADVHDQPEAGPAHQQRRSSGTSQTLRQRHSHQTQESIELQKMTNPERTSTSGSAASSSSDPDRLALAVASDAPQPQPDKGKGKQKADDADSIISIHPVEVEDEPQEAESPVLTQVNEFIGNVAAGVDTLMKRDFKVIALLNQQTELLTEMVTQIGQKADEQSTVIRALSHQVDKEIKDLKEMNRSAARILDHFQKNPDVVARIRQNIQNQKKD